MKVWVVIQHFCHGDGDCSVTLYGMYSDKVTAMRRHAEKSVGWGAQLLELELDKDLSEGI